MSSYVLPQVKVFQQFRQISTDVVGNLNACIIGPHYQLARYNEASEKELTRLNATYPIKGNFAPYPYNAKNVDEDYVKVFFEKVVADYADLERAIVFDNVIFNQYIKSSYRDLCMTGEPTAPELRIDAGGLLPISGGSRFYFLGRFKNAPSAQFSSDHFVVLAKDGTEELTNGGFSSSLNEDTASPLFIEAYNTNDELLFYLVVKSKYLVTYLDILQQRPTVYKDLPFLGIRLVDGDSSLVYKDGCLRLDLNTFLTKAAAKAVFEAPPFSNYLSYVSVPGASDEAVVSYRFVNGDPADDTGVDEYVFADTRHCGIYELGDVTDLGVKVGDTFSYTVGAGNTKEVSTVAGIVEYNLATANTDATLVGIRLLDAISFAEPLVHAADADVSYGTALSNAKVSRLQPGSFEIPKEKPDGTGENWSCINTNTECGIGFDSEIKVEVKNDDGTTRVITISSAKPFVEYRSLQTQYADTIHEVSNTNGVQTMLGSISIDNPLAQGCYHAILNSGDQPVYFIALTSDDVEGYTKALSRLEQADNIYSLVPLTTDDEVIERVQAHVKAMSGAESKLWRIAILGISTDQREAIYNNAHHPLDREYNATVKNTEIGTLVTFAPEDETVATDDVWPGDKFYYNFESNDGPIVRTVKSVIDNTHIVLLEREESDPSDKTYPEQDHMAKCEVWRDLSSARWIDHVANKISAFRDRRMYVIFPEVLWNNGNKYPGFIGAAAIAGLISSVPPQQGLTNIQVRGFDDIPLTYSIYTRSQLNHIADYGGLIIAQDVPNGEVYVRHQVSTAAQDGNLLTTELSVTKNLDAISYYLAGTLKPYIGKYNITPTLLEQIRTTLQGGLNYLGSYNTGSGLLGPMLLIDSEDTRIVGIRQHEILKDHVVCSITLDLPLPCNVIELYLSV